MFMILRTLPIVGQKVVDNIESLVKLCSFPISFVILRVLQILHAHIKLRDVVIFFHVSHTWKSPWATLVGLLSNPMSFLYFLCQFLILAIQQHNFACSLCSTVIRVYNSSLFPLLTSCHELRRLHIHSPIIKSGFSRMMYLSPACLPFSVSRSKTMFYRDGWANRSLSVRSVQGHLWHHHGPSTDLQELAGT